MNIPLCSRSMFEMHRGGNLNALRVHALQPCGGTSGDAESVSLCDVSSYGELEIKGSGCLDARAEADHERRRQTRR